ncbi:MAG: diguanylate cyclase [Polyangia bacterium]
MTTNRAQSVLVIEPQKAARERAGKLIEALGYEPRLAETVLEAHALFDHVSAVVAAHPAAMSIYPRLRATGTPLVAAFGVKDGDPAAIAREIGADAYVMRPYRQEMLGVALYACSVTRLLRERATRVETALGVLSDTGAEDEDKGKSNLLHIDLFKTLLPMEIRRARRHGYPIAICVVALDPLPDARKLSSDLVSASEPLLRRAVRDVDLLVRYGEGRFLVFLPHTDATGAVAVGQRIVTEIRSCRFKTQGVELMLTSSVGIASPKAGSTPSFARLIRNAHTALRAAQLKGGDRAIVRQ